MVNIVNDYNLFLCFEAVVNVPNRKEFDKLSLLVEKLGLIDFEYMRKLNDKYGFSKAFAYSGGIRKYSDDEICFEFNAGKGFTTGSKQGYLDYDNEIKILTVEDLEKATRYYVESEGDYIV